MFEYDLVSTAERFRELDKITVVVETEIINMELSMTSNL